MDTVIMVLVLMLVCLLTMIQGAVINAVIADDEPLTCWTCPNKTDNEECNNWAPDKYCPTNHTICQTIHRVNIHTGKSVQVNKMCALASECTQDSIGCHDTDIPGVKDCISCCNYAYCNEPVPFNHTAAIAYSSFPSSAAPISTPSSPGLILIVLISLTSLGLHTILVSTPGKHIEWTSSS